MQVGAKPVGTVTERLTPRARQIVTAARQLLETEGAEALSMRSLAHQLGIRAPSLYKHFESKDAIEAVLISIGFEEQAVIFDAALQASPDPLSAMAEAYHAYAQRNPQLYRLMYDRSLNRDLLIPGVEDAAALPAILAAGDEDLARAAWAFAHGMTILELNQRFPEGADLAAAWERGLSALRASVKRQVALTDAEG
jgi:AcrR family transcriptional regulator